MQKICIAGNTRPCSFRPYQHKQIPTHFLLSVHFYSSALSLTACSLTPFSRGIAWENMGLYLT